MEDVETDSLKNNKDTSSDMQISKNHIRSKDNLMIPSSSTLAHDGTSLCSDDDILDLNKQQIHDALNSDDPKILTLSCRTRHLPSLQLPDSDSNPEDLIKQYTIKGDDITSMTYQEWINTMSDNMLIDPFNFVEKQSREVIDGFYDDTLSASEARSLKTLRRYSNRFLRTKSTVTVDHELRPLNFVDVSCIGSEFYSCSAPVNPVMRNFFKFVYENVNLILMLTPFVEERRIKAERYLFPEQSGTDATYCVYGDMVVKSEIVEEDVNNNIVVTKVMIRPQIESVETQSPERTIYHIHFTGWTDHHVPDHTEFCSLIKMYQKYICITSSQPINTQILKTGLKPLIHCSAGIGRTGTWIGIQYLLDKIKTHRGSLHDIEFNLVELVLMMRDHRAGMVQTLGQFQFIYDYIKYHLMMIKDQTDADISD